jgi:hypothetical protein
MFQTAAQTAKWQCGNGGKGFEEFEPKSGKAAKILRGARALCRSVLSQSFARQELRAICRAKMKSHAKRTWQTWHTTAHHVWHSTASFDRFTRSKLRMACQPARNDWRLKELRAKSQR